MHRLPRWVQAARALEDKILSRASGGCGMLLAEDMRDGAELINTLCAEEGKSDGLRTLYVRNPREEADAAEPPLKRAKTSAPSNDHEHGISWHPIHCNMVAHFFVARLFDGPAIQIRAHMLVEPSEDTAHAHNGSLISYCVGGSYRHEVWHKRPDPASKEVFYETTRRGSNDFMPSVKRQGSFDLEYTHQHKAGDVWYMQAAPIFHKVCVGKHHLSSSYPVSIVIREKIPSYDGSHFVTVGAPMPEAVATASTREMVTQQEEEEKVRDLQEVCNAMQAFSQSMKAKECGEAAAAAVQDTLTLGDGSVEVLSAQGGEQAPAPGCLRTFVLCKEA